MIKESEDKIQGDCILWFNNNYLHLRKLLCYNLNNSRNKIDGARNKAKGLVPGRSDLVLYYQGKAYMIEMKTPDGSQEPTQKEWQRKITEQGFEYHICRSLAEFQSLIKSIIK